MRTAYSVCSPNAAGRGVEGAICYHGVVTARTDPGPATYADIEALPPHVVGEIIHGVLHANPRPAGPHSAAASDLGAELKVRFGRRTSGPSTPGGWIVLDEPELHLGEDVLVPDIGGWRRSTMATIPEGHRFVIPPDWVCEVLSPSTAGVDRIQKLPLYARYRVSHAWLVDPIQRTLEVFRRQESSWLLVGTYAGDAVVSAEPFAEIEIELRHLWDVAPDEG